MVIRKRKAQLERMEAELAALRTEVGHARYDLAQIDREAYSQIKASFEQLREQVGALVRAAEANQASRVIVGPTPPAEDMTVLEIYFRNADHALETAEALRQSAHATMSGREGT